MTDNNECRILINIPADENYIEILGHRIDGFESFEAFLEHLKKYAELEETVKSQKAEIERLTVPKELIDDDFCGVVCEFAEEIIEKAKAEAVKEFAERLKRKAVMVRGNLTIRFLIDTYSIDNLVNEMVGEE